MPLKARRGAEGLGRGEKEGNKGGRKARKGRERRKAPEQKAVGAPKALKSRNKK